MVVRAFLIGCAVLLVVGCAGVRSEAPKEQEQGRSPEATASEQAQCEGTRTTSEASASATPTTTNDLPGCPKGGLLLGTEGSDNLDGSLDRQGRILRGLGGPDFILGGAGNDVIYGGPGDDSPLNGGAGGDDVIYGGDGDEREIAGGNGNDVIYGGDGNDRIYERDAWGHDKLYCGKGKDTYEADKNDFVSSSCETALEDQEETTPPDSTLTHGGREVKGMLGSYCFSGNSGGTCVDTSWPLIPSKRKTLTVPPDSEMVFRYGGQDPPKTVEARAYSLKKLQEKIPAMRPDSSLEAQGSGVQRTIPAELPPGEYVLEVSVTVQQGDSSYYFRIMVE
jgi:hypothetical protein